MTGPTPTRWSLAFFDAKGNDISRGWSVDTLTDAIRRVLLRFETNPACRYATLSIRDRPFALIAVAGDHKATVTAMVTDDRALTDKERRALAHIENYLRSGVRVHLRGNLPVWRLHRARPAPPC